MMHSDTRDFQCEKCLKRFKLSSHLKTHYAVHEENALFCSICQKSFSLKESLKKHIKKFINESKTFLAIIVVKNSAEKIIL